MRNIVRLTEKQILELALMLTDADNNGRPARILTDTDKEGRTFIKWDNGTGWTPALHGEPGL